MNPIIFALGLFSLYAICRWYDERKKEPLFDRAYAFRKKRYSIYHHTISLSPPKGEYEIDQPALFDSLTELFLSMNNLAEAMRSGVNVQSYAPVWFNLDLCLRFPFHAIDASEVLLSPRLRGMLCSNIEFNPVIERITLPNELIRFSFGISCCPNLKELRIPSFNGVVELSFSDGTDPIYDVHPDFTILVPSELLPEYQRRYSNKTIRYSDGTTSPVRFSSYIPRRIESPSTPESKNA